MTQRVSVRLGQNNAFDVVVGDVYQCTVSQLKAAIAAETGIPPQHQSIRLDGACLAVDDAALADYGVCSEGSELWLSYTGPDLLKTLFTSYDAALLRDVLNDAVATMQVEYESMAAPLRTVIDGMTKGIFNAVQSHFFILMALSIPSFVARVGYRCNEAKFRLFNRNLKYHMDKLRGHGSGMGAVVYPPEIPEHRNWRLSEFVFYMRSLYVMGTPWLPHRSRIAPKEYEMPAYGFAQVKKTPKVRQKVKAKRLATDAKPEPTAATSTTDRKSDHTNAVIDAALKAAAETALLDPSGKEEDRSLMDEFVDSAMEADAAVNIKREEEEEEGIPRIVAAYNESRRTRLEPSQPPSPTST